MSWRSGRSADVATSPAVDAQAFAERATVERLTDACIKWSAARARHRNAPGVGVLRLQHVDRRRVVRVDVRGTAAGDDVGPRRGAWVHERVERAALRGFDCDEVGRLERSTHVRRATACAARAPSGCGSTSCASASCASACCASTCRASACRASASCTSTRCASSSCASSARASSARASSGCASAGRGVPACRATINTDDRSPTRHTHDRNDDDELSHAGGVLHLRPRRSPPPVPNGPRRFPAALTPCSRCPSSCARCSRGASTPSTSTTRWPAPGTRWACSRRS